MGDKVKVSVLEVNGVEENEGPCERSLTADIVEVNPTINGLDDVQAVLEELADDDDSLDGGLANSVYTVDQCFDGGGA